MRCDTLESARVYAVVGQADRDMVRTAINRWEKYSPFDFVYRKTPRAGEHYLLISDADACRAELGYSGHGTQFLELGASFCNEENLVHELGHTLGLEHEHQRTDRDKFITVVPEAMADGADAQFERIIEPWGVYNRHSAMHYDNFNGAAKIDQPVILAPRLC